MPRLILSDGHAKYTVVIRRSSFQLGFHIDAIVDSNHMCPTSPRSNCAASWKATKAMARRTAFLWAGFRWGDCWLYKPSICHTPPMKKKTILPAYPNRQRRSEWVLGPLPQGSSKYLQSLHGPSLILLINRAERAVAWRRQPSQAFCEILPTIPGSRRSRKSSLSLKMRIWELTESSSFRRSGKRQEPLWPMDRSLPRKDLFQSERLV